MHRLIPRGAAGVLVGLLVLILLVPVARAARGGSARLQAGAASVQVAVPEGTPLAGYGGFPRRAWIPDILGRHPYAFWFRPSGGVHDPLKVRSLLLEAGATRVLWLALDLVGMDRSLVAELRARLEGRGLRYTAIVAAASHTHSGPGAYADSALFAFVAVDRLSPTVRARLLDGLERAAWGAESAKGPAAVGSGSAEVTGIAVSRLRAPLDQELGLLKVTRPDGRPVAVLWNYAVHGTALDRENLLLSGDLMGYAAARIERELRAPALFVNGAVGDVSPRERGWGGMRSAGERLAAAVLAGWRGTKTDRAPTLAVTHERLALPAPRLALRNCLGRWIPPGWQVGLSEAMPSSAEVMAVAVGRTAWVTIPGELETRLGMEIKAGRRGPFGHVFVAGLANDYLGYLLTPEAYREPSYIACGSLYGERGGEIVRDGALQALERLARQRERR